MLKWIKSFTCAYVQGQAGWPPQILANFQVPTVRNPVDISKQILLLKSLLQQIIASSTRAVEQNRRAFLSAATKEVARRCPTTVTPWTPTRPTRRWRRPTIVRLLELDTPLLDTLISEGFLLAKLLFRCKER